MVKKSYILVHHSFQSVVMAAEMLDYPAAGPNLLFLEDRKFHRNPECVRLEHCVSYPGYVVYTIYGIAKRAQLASQHRPKTRCELPHYC